VVFDNKGAEEVHPSEIEALVEKRAPERQCLDFKRQPWGTTSSEKSERLRDIVAMANGGGGYILVGIKEDKQGRACEVAHTSAAGQQVDSILNASTNGIEPRLDSLEAAVCSTGVGDVVVVRVPPATPLCAVATGGRLDYWRRYVTTKNRMTHGEIASAFGAATGNGALSSNAVDLAPSQRKTLPPDALQFRNVMDLRADHEIADRPYYRATLTPHNLGRSGAFDHELRDLMQHPPRTRRGGFHIWELALTQSGDTLLGMNASRGHQVMLHRNGFVEFRCPMASDLHEIELRGRRGPLNPYPLIELPVSFYRLALSIYAHLEIGGPAIARHSYHNIRKFRLAPGVPESDEWAKEYPGSAFDSRDVYIADTNSFDPDAIVYELIEEFYAAFGFGPDMIPLFDEDHHFQP
jgi:hypothetical protein